MQILNPKIIGLYPLARLFLLSSLYSSYFSGSWHPIWYITPLAALPLSSSLTHHCYSHCHYLSICHNHPSHQYCHRITIGSQYDTLPPCCTSHILISISLIPRSLIAITIVVVFIIIIYVSVIVILVITIVIIWLLAFKMIHYAKMHFPSLCPRVLMLHPPLRKTWKQKGFSLAELSKI